MPNRTLYVLTLSLLTAVPLGAIPTGCIPRRIETVSKVETTHKIEAHIVLDIRQIREEAASIEKEVRSDAPESAPSAGEPQAAARLRIEGRMLASTASSLLGIFDVASPAVADTPQEREAIERRKGRFADVDRRLTAGHVGENNKGMLELRSAPPDQKTAAEALVRDENADRKIIYSEGAVRAGLDSADFQKYGEVYALEIFKTLKSGQQFQVPSDSRLHDEFKRSSLGQKVSSAGKGEWVRVP